MSQRPTERALESDERQLGLLHRVRRPNELHAPLVFLVHGRAGNLNVMSVFLRAIPETWGIVVPQAPLADPTGGFSWWGMGEASFGAIDEQDSASKLASAFIMNSRALYAPQCTGSIGIGFSQGGVLLGLAAQLDPQLFLGVGLLASDYVDRRGTSPLPPFFVAHGEKDQIIPVDRVRNSLVALKRRSSFVSYIEEPGLGHKVGSTSIRELGKWVTALDVTK